MKIIMMLSLLSLFASCDLFEKSSSPVASIVPVIGYQQCEPVPTGLIVEHSGCPGSAGTWNNYEIIKDSSGTVVSIDLYCGGGDNEHAMDQAEYDGYAGLGETSNADYKQGLDCVSGSRTEIITGDKTFNIWQKI